MLSSPLFFLYDFVSTILGFIVFEVYFSFCGLCSFVFAVNHKPANQLASYYNRLDFDFRVLVFTVVFVRFAVGGRFCAHFSMYLFKLVSLFKTIKGLICYQLTKQLIID